jgi:hypothetical protein
LNNTSYLNHSKHFLEQIAKLFLPGPCVAFYRSKKVYWSQSVSLKRLLKFSAIFSTPHLCGKLCEVVSQSLAFIPSSAIQNVFSKARCANSYKIIKITTTATAYRGGTRA